MERPQVLPVPSPRSIIDTDGPVIIDPITRRGTGPGLILLVSEASSGLYIDHGVPSPLQKWGEEGYSVVEITAAILKTHKPEVIVKAAVDALTANEKCQPPDSIGLVAYDRTLWSMIAPVLPEFSGIVAAVVYADAGDTDDKLTSSPVPVLVHVAGKSSRKLVRSQDRVEYDYATQVAGFASPRTPDFDYAAEAVSHSRSLAHLKKLMNGPYFDLEAIWDEHTYWEFEMRDVEATMNTMVQEPYVNHIPTLTGGIGRADLTDFYQNHFVFNNPRDTELEVISRTVGIDRVVDEFVMKMTHDTIVDWLFPAVPATHKYIEVPFIAVVNVRGDRLYHEHITWDHASALRQIGWLPEALPYQPAEPAHPINGHTNGVNGVSGKKQMLILPVAGSETAAKLRNKNSVVSNAMFTEAGPKPSLG